MRRRVAAVALAVLLVTTGCVGSLPFDRGDPDDDRLGSEGGYWYDDPVSVTTEDGLNESEREAVVARTMARVEELRGLEFRESVPVEVISREEYRERRSSSSGTATAEGPSTYQRWNEQVWEALFLNGEDESIAERFDTVYSESVVGFYSPGRDEIVIVSDSETPALDRATLAHELVHALQDQQLNLGGSQDTQDTQLAVDGIVEGDANYVESLYESRCERDWDCLERPERSGGGGGGLDGVFLTIFTPYAEGPALVGALRQRSGGDWDAVNDAYEDLPASAEQVIHPERYPDEEPATIEVGDRTRNGWERFDLEQDTDTVGEASIYAMLWANEVVAREDRSPYRYEFAASEGWAGDTLVPYRKPTSDGEQYGYVWRVEWDTTADAREFHEAYHEVLASRDAREVRDGVFVVEDGGYADAFRVSIEGRTVTVVNAPTRADLRDVRVPE
jgi:hypothetical protein